MRPAPKFVPRRLPRPIVLLAVALMALGIGAIATIRLVEDARSWLRYDSANECHATSDAGGCWTESAATVLDVSVDDTGRGPAETTYLLGVPSGQREAAVPGRLEGPTEGGVIYVRLFDGDVMAIGDRSTWVETTANPRIALPRSIAATGWFIGVGMAILIPAVALRRAAGSWLRRYDLKPGAPRPLRGTAAATSLVLMVTPAPAIFTTLVLQVRSAVWLPPLLDAGTASATIAVVAYVRHRRSKQPAEAD